MIFKCEIEMDNAAFDPDPLLELRRLLINAAMRFEQLQGSDPLGLKIREGKWLDKNGNKVGSYTIEGEN